MLVCEFQEKVGKKKKQVTQPLQPPHENCRLVSGQGEAFSFRCNASSWIDSKLSGFTCGMLSDSHYNYLSFLMHFCDFHVFLL